MKITRRSAMKMTATAVAAPVVLRAQDALAQSGTVKVLVWQDYIQPNIAEKFEADTGITLELTTFGSNNEAESTISSAGGKGFDVVATARTLHEGEKHEYQACRQQVESQLACALSAPYPARRSDKQYPHPELGYSYPAS